MRNFWIVGNWKMNGTRADAAALVSAIGQATGSSDSVQLVVCPPFVHLDCVRKVISESGYKIGLGAQNLALQEVGAYTGEVSAAMLKDMACEYVIVGHSERRALFGESNHLVAEKYLKALQHQLVPILCLGETLEERQSNKTREVILAQLQAVIDYAGVESFQRSAIAYEPVWAIGTGLSASPEQAQEVHQLIRATIEQYSQPIADSLTILYGGSVKAENAEGLFSQPDIDGGLIGGASLAAKEFIAIAVIAKKLVE